MFFFLLAKRVSEERVGGDIDGLRLYGDKILPVFTSPESLRRFMAGNDIDEQGTPWDVAVMKDPLELADTGEHFEEREFKSLIFDPLTVPSGDDLWTRVRTISLSDYRRFIEQIRPAFETLTPEASRLRQEEEVVGIHHLSAEVIAAELRAQIEEWLGQ
jgi:hypothetical protein